LNLEPAAGQSSTGEKESHFMLMRKRVWDVMRTDFVSVSEDAGLIHVIKALHRGLKEHPANNFVLVFSDEPAGGEQQGTFRGLVTMWNVLQALGPCLLKDISLWKDVDWDEAYHGGLRSCTRVGIRDVLQRDMPRVKPSDPLVRIMELFLDYRRGRAVVEDGGRILGVILLNDIFQEIAEDIERW
jgi:CBS domain-containing protein